MMNEDNAAGRGVASSQSDFLQQLHSESEEILNGRGGSFEMPFADEMSAVKKESFEGNGAKVPLEELLNRTLPDYLRHNLDMIFIGINPGLVAAEKQRYYAGSGNHFWKCMYASGIIPEQLTSLDDYRLPDYGIGLTNMVERTTRGSGDLKAQEIKEGGQILLKKLLQYNPKIAVFNGKEIYRIFSGKKNFCFGKQPEPVEGTNIHAFVMPSSSARCAQLPRVSDKIPFYEALKKLRDYLRGEVPFLDESEVTFSSALKSPAKRKSMEEAEDFEGDESSRVNGDNGNAAALDLSQGLSNPRASSSVHVKSEGSSIFDPFNLQESHFSGRNQQDELERLLANSTPPVTSTTADRVPPGAANALLNQVLTQPTTSTSASSPTGFNHVAPQGIHQVCPLVITRDVLERRQDLFQQSASFTAGFQQPGMRDPSQIVGAGFGQQAYAFEQRIKEEMTAVAEPRSLAESGSVHQSRPSGVKQEMAQDMDLVSQHIRECVAAVVQRCKDGTQDFPEHYIRPSTPPGARAAHQFQHHQQQQQQHHTQQQQQSQQAQQHTPPQNVEQPTPAAALNQAVYQAAAQNRGSAPNQVAALDAAQYLNPYFQQQQLAAAYGIPSLQRAMQGNTGQWPSADFYNALNPYLQQQQQANQQQSPQQQQQQQQQFRQQGQADLYGTGTYFGAGSAQGYGGQTQPQLGSQQQRGNDGQVNY